MYVSAMRLALKLRGTNASGRKFEEMTTTEDVSARGFLCNCMSALVKDAIVEVTLSGGSERYVGRAQVVRKESSGTPLASVRLRVSGENA
jgi:hypothetical protein